MTEQEQDKLRILITEIDQNFKRAVSKANILVDTIGGIVKMCHVQEGDTMEVLMLKHQLTDFCGEELKRLNME